jgi:hypothetical protein
MLKEIDIKSLFFKIIFYNFAAMQYRNAYTYWERKGFIFRKFLFVFLILFISAVQVHGQNFWFSDDSDNLDQLFIHPKDSSSMITKKFPSASWDPEKIDLYKYDFKNYRDTFHVVLANAAENLHFVHPIPKGRVTSGFGPRWGRFHYGIDLMLNVGDTVVAAMNGVVRMATYEPGYGNFIVITHPNGLETLYGHLSGFISNPGDSVFAGDPIGLGGSTGFSTGPHLHFEIRFLGEQIDPARIFAFHENKLYFNHLYITPSHFAHLSRNPHTYAVQRPTANYGGNAGNMVYHTIRNGDCLSVIAQKYHVSIWTICQLNGITVNSILRPGKVLRIR